MASPGDKVYPTVQQLRAVGAYVQTAGLVTGMSYRDTADQYDLLSSWSLKFTLTTESLEAGGYDPDDTSIEQRVPGVDQTSCTETATVDWAGLQFGIEGDTSIYGPEPALDHTDWVGASGVTSPDSGGNFTVSDGTGTLTLTIPSNYGDLCDDIPNQNLPTGMPGCPQITWYHRADLWRSYDGEDDQQSPPQPYSIPAEGVYCWRGFPCLRLRVIAPAASLLTVTITGKTHSHTDIHKSDSTRQTDYVHTTSSFTYRYKVWVEAGTDTGTIYLQLAADTSDNPVTDPDLEQVETVQITGFAEGAWKWAADPYLSADPVASRIRIKAFEGPEYRHGGVSAVNSPEYKFSLMDTTEDNYGHDNRVEYTVRYFDYVVGATSGLDLTVAETLQSYAKHLHRVCDAWTCSMNTTAYEDACKDNETPQNTLTTCWGFDICHEDPSDPDDPLPLLQNVGTTLNCSISCGTWAIATGIRYLIRTDKVLDSNGHGVAYYNLRRPARSVQNIVQVWRPPSGATTWAADGSPVDVDAYALWDSDSREEFNAGDGYRWEFGISVAGEAEASETLGELPVREYVGKAIRLPQPDERGVDMFRHPAGNVTWTVWIDGDDIKIAETSNGITTLATPVTIDGSGDYDAVSAETDGSTIIVDARRTSDHALVRWYSQDFGATWTGPTVIAT